MEKIFLMSPKQSGKTDKALYEYSKDPENTIFVSPNMKCSDVSRKKINGDKRNFVSFDNLERKLVGRRPKTLILDEYMIWGKKSLLNSIIYNLNLEKLLIFSSSDKIYRKEIFDYVKDNKYSMGSNELSENLFEKYPHLLFNKDYIKQVDELYYNFITDNDITLIDSGFESGLLYKEGIKDILGDYRFRLEILNEYLCEGEDDDEKYPKILLKYNI